MMNTQATPTRRITLPNELDSPQAKLVYLYLDQHGSATQDELSDALSMKKLSVLSVLRSLSTDNLLERDGNRITVRN